MDEFASVVLKPRKALPFFSRHPWVFAGAIERIEGECAAGDVVSLNAHDGQFIAWGLFNPDSNIRVRLYTWDRSQSLDTDFWAARIDTALELRSRLPGGGEQRSAQRLIYSEADGLSGLIVDRYAEWLSVQWTSRALEQRREELLELLQQKTGARGIWQRTERGLREAEGLQVEDGLAAGEEPPRPVIIDEDAMRLGVDIQAGHKTGYYLDQRANRKAVAAYCADRRVLDMFCYTGGFSLAAAHWGRAASVLGIDSSRTAVEAARANADLNEVGDRTRFECEDAYRALERMVEQQQQSDVIILDPPKMARHRSGLRKALRGYFSLNRLAVDLLPPGGILVSCSCSGLVDVAAFEAMLQSVAVQTRRPIQILERRGAAADHPVSVTCPENEYLKCLICRVA